MSPTELCSGGRRCQHSAAHTLSLMKLTLITAVVNPIVAATGVLKFISWVLLSSPVHSPTGTEGTSKAPAQGSTAPRVVPARAAVPAAMTVYFTT